MTGVEHQTELPKTLPFDSSSIEDQEVPDDPSAPTVPDAAAAAAAAEAYNAGAAARQDTLQKLQTLQGQLAEVRLVERCRPILKHALAGAQHSYSVHNSSPIIALLHGLRVVECGVVWSLLVTAVLSHQATSSVLPTAAGDASECCSSC